MSKSIFKRRSVRKYSDKVVEKEKIIKLLQAGMQGPTAVNQQAWEFVVVQEKGNLEKLSKMSDYSGMVKNASVVIAVLGNFDIMKAPTFWEQDSAAAIENILIEAVELELGAVWLGVSPIEERVDYVTEALKLPKHVKPIGIISIGYPMDNDANKFVDRYDPKKVHYEKY